MADTPKVRFKGFTDNWEQCKLGEVCEFLNGDRSENYPASSDFQERGIPFIGSDALGGTEINMEKVRFISKDKYEAMKGIKIQEGDILYTLRGAGFGKNSLADFNGGTVASSLVGIRCDNENIVNVFLTQWFNSVEANNEKKQAVNGSTAQNISVDDMKKYLVSLPVIDEQKQIGKYFYKLDHLITLHQRKCDETKELKKYMLKKMLPQKGKKIPEIRFAGFTEDWEQRRFGDIGSVSMCKRIFKDETADGGDIPFYKIGTFGGEPDAYISRELFEEYRAKFSYPKEGDILLSASGTIGRIVEYDGEEAYFQDSNIVWLSHDDSVSNKFLKILYSTVKWDGIEGSTIQRLYNDNFLKTRFMMPKLEEQEKLGEYFGQLDHFIILHQRKCDQLKELKKFMLQNMFPQKG